MSSSSCTDRPGEEKRGFRRGFACSRLRNTEPGRGRKSYGLSPCGVERCRGFIRKSVWYEVMTEVMTLFC